MSEAATQAAPLFVITGPMVMSGVTTLLMAGFWYWKKKDDKLEEQAKAKAEEEERVKAAAIHESFAKQEAETKALVEQTHKLELAVANLVRREELEGIYERIEARAAETRQDMKDVVKGVDDLKNVIITCFAGASERKGLS